MYMYMYMHDKCTLYVYMQSLPPNSFTCTNVPWGEGATKSSTATLLPSEAAAMIRTTHNTVKTMQVYNMLHVHVRVFHQRLYLMVPLPCNFLPWRSILCVCVVKLVKMWVTGGYTTWLVLTVPHSYNQCIPLPWYMHVMQETLKVKQNEPKDEGRQLEQKYITPYLLSSMPVHQNHLLSLWDRSYTVD